MYKGLIYHTLAKLIFVLSGYVMHYFLGYALSPYEYGVVGTITTVLDFEYLFLNNGVRQAISENLSQEKYNSKDLFIKGLLFQIGIIFILCVVDIFGAAIMGDILNDQRLVFYIKLAALLIPFNGIYFVILGTINGFCLFKQEAMLCTIYPILKLSVIPLILFVFSNDAVLGTEMGYFTGVSGICVIGGFVLIKYRKKFTNVGQQKIDMKIFAKSAMNFSVFFIVVSVMLSVDTLILKSVSANGDYVGYYTGAVTFGKISYYLLSAFYIVLLPVISKKYINGEIEKAKSTISDLLLLILIFILPISIILAATSGKLLTVFYKPEYAIASNAMSMLTFTNFFMGMVVVFNMIISITAKKRFSSILSIVMVIVQVPLCYLLTKIWTINGTALSGLLCSTVTMVISAIYVKHIFGQYIHRKHIGCIIVNLLFFIFVKVLDIVTLKVNLIILVFVYAGLYFLCILIMRLCNLYTFKDFLSMLKKKN